MNTARLYLTFRHLELAAQIAFYSPDVHYGSPAYHAALTIWCMLDLAASTIRDAATGHLATPAAARHRADLYTRTDPQAPHRATACHLAADVLEAPADILASLARAGVPVDALVAACPDLGPALGVGEGEERGETCGANVDRNYGGEWTSLVCALPRGHHGDHNTAEDGGGGIFPNRGYDTPIPFAHSDTRIAMAEEPLPRGPDPVPFLAIIHDRNRTHQDAAAPAVLSAPVGCGHAGNPDAVCSDCGWQS
jgi:hypothetical protein